MVVVSLLTRSTVPADVGRTMLVLHAPEALGLRLGDDRSSREQTAQRSRRAGRRTAR
jgi:hypothetical protein